MYYKYNLVDYIYWNEDNLQEILNEEVCCVKRVLNSIIISNVYILLKYTVLFKSCI